MINRNEIGHRITLPHSGVRVYAPNEVQGVLESIEERRLTHTPLPSHTRQTLWTPEQRARIALLKRNKVYGSRWPTREVGREFMEQVDPLRHLELLRLAFDMTDHTVSAWQKIGESPIAVVVFGSVATGLVKSRFHPDPSNIDLTVIGSFQPDEKTALLDSIRGKREEIAEIIRTTSPNLDRTQDPLPGNVGVCVQNIQTLTKDCFGEARVYLASGAYALHDRAGIWQAIDQGAVAAERSVLDKKGTHTKRKLS